MEDDRRRLQMLSVRGTLRLTQEERMPGACRPAVTVIGHGKWRGNGHGARARTRARASSALATFFPPPSELRASFLWESISPFLGSFRDPLVQPNHQAFPGLNWLELSRSKDTRLRLVPMSRIGRDNKLHWSYRLVAIGSLPLGCIRIV